MISASCALQDGTTCESEIDVLNLVVFGVLLGIETLVPVLWPFYFIVARVKPARGRGVTTVRRFCA
jgi:hypothetical protein